MRLYPEIADSARVGQVYGGLPSRRARRQQPPARNAGGDTPAAGPGLARRLFGLHPRDVLVALSDLMETQYHEVAGLQAELAQLRGERQALADQLRAVNHRYETDRERLHQLLAGGVTDLLRSHDAVQEHAKLQTEITGRILDQVEERQETLERLEHAATIIANGVKASLQEAQAIVDGTAEIRVADFSPAAALPADRRKEARQASQ